MTKILQFFDQEAQLVRALCRGDGRAQREVYERFSAKMLGVCIRYTGDKMSAEDVLVEGFMKVFTKIGQFKGEGSLEAWMRKIMVNEALGYLRIQKRWNEVELEEVHDIPDYLPADQHVEEEELLALVNQLPTGYRTVFNLYAIEGYAHAEIAALLSITESTSKSQLHRARALLQQWLLTCETNSK